MRGGVRKGLLGQWVDLRGRANECGWERHELDGVGQGGVRKKRRREIRGGGGAGGGAKSRRGGAHAES